MGKYYPQEDEWLLKINSEDYVAIKKVLNPDFIQTMF